MELWQTILAAVLGALTVLGGGLRWFLTWLFREIEKLENSHKAAETEFLVALNQERAACEREREEHRKQVQELLDSARELQDKRVEDARASAAALYDVAQKLRLDRSSTAPGSR